LKKIAFIIVLFISPLSWSQQFVVLEKPTDKKEASENKEVITRKEKVAELKPVTKEEPVIKEETFSEEEYSKLLNHIPKSFVANIKSKPLNKVLEGNLNSISSLELRYAYQQQLKLTGAEVKWLESEAEQLSIAFFAEGKPILLRKTGEYGNCNGRSIATEERGSQKITIVKFCYTCPGATVYEDRFIEVFNKRTEMLITASQRK